MTSTPLEQPAAGARRLADGEIIVGVDGTYAAGEALGWAARLARATGWRLSALNAWEPKLEGYESGLPRAARRHRSELRRWCEPATAVGVDAEPIVRDGSPDEVLVAAAGGHPGPGERLVVIGHTARGADLDHDLDHQCDRIAKRIAVPLAVVPSPGGGRAFARVVLGLDDSAGARAAAAWLSALAGVVDLDVFAVTACEPVVEWVLRSNPASQWSTVRRHLDGPWTEPLRRAGVACTTDVVERANVVHALTQYARDRHADAIVVGLSAAGHRGRHSGSALVDHCHLPVVLVPPDAAVAGDQHR